MKNENIIDVPRSTDNSNLQITNATQSNLEISNAMQPKDIVSNSVKQAKELAKLVDQNKWATNIQGKKYLHVEAWETIGLFNGVSAKVTDVERIVRDDGVVGYKAKAELVNKDGNVIGQGFGFCFKDEKSKKFFDEYALAGMAQTRAISRAFRHVFSPVVVLAGYEPTPAEEMPKTASKTATEGNKYRSYVEALHNTGKITKEKFEEVKDDEKKSYQLLLSLKKKKNA